MAIYGDHTIDESSYADLPLLSVKTAKMEKSLSFGFLTAVFHGRSAYTVTVPDGEKISTCPYATPACMRCCISHTGQLRLPDGVKAMHRRTQLLLTSPSKFLTQLDREIAKWQRSAARKNFGYGVRLNGTTDFDWSKILLDGRSLFERHAKIQFYDYTKDLVKAITNSAKNYHLTYSWNERSDSRAVRELLEKGGNVAIVYDIKKTEPLPEKWELSGKKFRVIDGDVSDLRFQDPAGTIVGLRYKMAFQNGKQVDRSKLKGFLLPV